MYDLKQLSRLSETHNVKPTVHCLWLDSGPVIYMFVWGDKSALSCLFSKILRYAIYVRSCYYLVSANPMFLCDRRSFKPHQDLINLPKKTFVLDKLTVTQNKTSALQDGRFNSLT